MRIQIDVALSNDFMWNWVVRINNRVKIAGKPCKTASEALETADKEAIEYLKSIF